MRVSPRHIAIFPLAALLIAQLLLTGPHAVLALVATAHAVEVSAPTPERDKKAQAPVGYGGPHLRLFPMMVPYHTSGGVLYQPLVVEVELATGGGAAGGSLSEQGDAREKQACWALPIVHEKLLMYLFDAHLVSDDFVGERRDVLTKNLFDVVINTVGRGYYASLSLVPDDAPDLDSKSKELSKQCH